MQPVFEGWTIVMVGGWNPKIFQPDWVVEHLFPGQDITAEFLLQSGVQQLRLSVGSTLLLPGSERVVVGVTEDSNAAIQSQEVTAVQVLTLLGHTPLRAVGINFRFVEDDPSEDLLAVFELSDRQALAEAAEIRPEADVRRKVAVGGEEVGLRMAYADGKVEFFLNFHRPVANAAEGVAVVEGRVSDYRNVAEQLLVDVYELELAASDDDQDEEGV